MKRITKELILDLFSLIPIMLGYYLIKLSRRETRQIAFCEMLKKENDIEDVILIKKDLQFFGVDINEKDIM